MQGSKKHAAFDGRIPKWNAGFIHPVVVPWRGPWINSSASILEVFGLPGNKFVSHAKPDSLEFYFKSKKDAQLCRILLSEHIE